MLGSPGGVLAKLGADLCSIRLLTGIPALDTAGHTSTHGSEGPPSAKVSMLRYVGFMKGAIHYCQEQCLCVILMLWRQHVCLCFAPSTSVCMSISISIVVCLCFTSVVWADACIVAYTCFWAVINRHMGQLTCSLTIAWRDTSAAAASLWGGTGSAFSMACSLQDEYTSMLQTLVGALHMNLSVAKSARARAEEDLLQSQVQLKQTLVLHVMHCGCTAFHPSQ